LPATDRKDRVAHHPGSDAALIGQEEECSPKPPPLTEPVQGTLVLAVERHERQRGRCPPAALSAKWYGDQTSLQPSAPGPPACMSPAAVSLHPEPAPR
jgi:hypothetical protein